ncbi:hotdog fold thioesterase [Maribellus comscasis]|uniref:Hotdog fold thioesterase n=1 Tax=Maribellus comscasis TaxID=2681766 RepID=A0A6I6JUE4_9BACT|nr:PaaI family thioesterase [Maribellus comscasis]QGY44690.1 hotdog fold thioesterase [Maribellus comscasis]
MDEIKALNEFCAQSMIGLLGIKFTRFSSDNIEASMPVNSNTIQPNGFLHGGASLALAETLAGAGSYLMVDREKFNVFGLQVSGNHISSVKEGILQANAQIIHKGKTTHVWEVKITDENHKLISTVRVTNIIADKKKEEV